MCLAIPGKILTIAGTDPLMRTARVSFGGVVKNVCLAYVPESRIGDYVIVHAGFAISLLDERAALRVFEHLQAMDDLAEIQESTGDEVY